jgi:putative transposase
MPKQMNEVWSMDFMHDQLSDGRSVRLFSVIDDFSRDYVLMWISRCRLSV